jgi:hypothetical protein
MTNTRLKLSIALAILLAALASSASLAATASATEALTGAQWLFGGEEVKSSLNVEYEAEILLEDSKASGLKASVKCSMILDGSITSDGEGEIKELLNLSKEAISLTPLSELALACTDEENCAEPKAWAVDLGWPISLTEAEVSEKELFIVSVEKGSSGSPGWYVECTILGIKVSDECVDEELVAEAANVTGGVELAFSASLAEQVGQPLATCSISKEATGLAEGKGTLKAESGTVAVAAQGGPTVDANPNPANFGQINANETLELEIVFTNLGPGAWTPGAPGIDIGPATFLIVAGSNTCNVAIAVNGTCLILLEFAPKDAASTYLGRFGFGNLTMWLMGTTK